MYAMWSLLNQVTVKWGWDQVWTECWTCIIQIRSSNSGGIANKIYQRFTENNLRCVPDCVRRTTNWIPGYTRLMWSLVCESSLLDLSSSLLILHLAVMEGSGSLFRNSFSRNGHFAMLCNAVQNHEAAHLPPYGRLEWLQYKRPCHRFISTNFTSCIRYEGFYWGLRSN